MCNNLKIIVPDNFRDFGERVNNHIKTFAKSDENYVIKPSLTRFNNGEGKCILEDSLRGKDAYILTDVTNYSICYNSQAGIHHMMPDEHFQDIKRIISATCCHAKKITVIMPYLYQSRQDKRNGRESLDLAIALQDLKYMGVNELITADVHNKPAVDNASPKMGIDNFYCTDDILCELFQNEKIDADKLMVIAPDRGALPRANFYSSILGRVPLGMFEKQRDYTKIEDGKNPITEHTFLSNASLDGMTALVVDDMIASGSSILDTAYQLKQKGADKVFLLTTFGLFTSGYKKFDEYYDKKVFDRVYTTNLNYVPDEIKMKEWYKEVDASLKVANIIYNLNTEKSIGKLLNAKEETLKKIRIR